VFLVACILSVQRLVNEHLSLLDLPVDASASTSKLDPKSTGKERHVRKSSLVMMYDSEALEAESGVAKNLPDELSAHVQVEIEIPQHKLQALYMLRVLRIRELRARILGVLNYFRSMHKTLVKDEILHTDAVEHSGLGAKKSSAATAGARLYNPADIIARASTCAELEDRSDEWSFDASAGSASTDHIIVRDARKKVRIVYDAAVTDLSQLETELLALASIYIERHQYVGMGMKGEADTEIAAYQNLLNSLDGSISTATGNQSVAGKYFSRNRDSFGTAHNQTEEERFYPDPLLISSRSASVHSTVTVVGLPSVASSCHFLPSAFFLQDIEVRRQRRPLVGVGRPVRA
jgi:hypothetical protein